MNYRSNGKLLLTGEYVVLDGAKALAVPTTYGQSLSVLERNSKGIYWESYNSEGVLWYSGKFDLKNGAISSNNSDALDLKLIKILEALLVLNPNSFEEQSGYNITTSLDFPNNWGLGSSSTLIYNLAQFANVNAYDLLDITFGGSGYDIACAQYDSAITYQIGKKREIAQVEFDPSFSDKLFFVHLNKKQNSRDGIFHYNNTKSNLEKAITEINQITQDIIECTTLSEFERLIQLHESIIAQLMKTPTIKESLFSNYKGVIKSLGAWGGDFILASGDSQSRDYFKSKGFSTIVEFKTMLL